MKVKNTFTPGILALCLFMAHLASPAFLAEARAEDVVAIVSRSQDMKPLTLKELRDINQGDRKVWANGEAIELFLPPEKSPAMQVLLNEVFRKSSSTDLFKFYLRAIFMNKFSRPPKSYASTGEALAFIHDTPNGIALVSASEAEFDDSVRVVRIQRPSAP